MDPITRLLIEWWLWGVILAAFVGGMSYVAMMPFARYQSVNHPYHLLYRHVRRGVSLTAKKAIFVIVFVTYVLSTVVLTYAPQDITWYRITTASLVVISGLVLRWYLIRRHLRPPPGHPAHRAATWND